uniref:Putative secreted protein n=1 Tax=Ixodes ricinus TaxID=34613 RepID=A0A6B0UNL1_IXORI
MYTFLLVCLPPHVLAIPHLPQVVTISILPTCFKYFASPHNLEFHHSLHFSYIAFPTFKPLHLSLHVSALASIPTCVNYLTSPHMFSYFASPRNSSYFTFSQMFLLFHLPPKVFTTSPPPTF